MGWQIVFPHNEFGPAAQTIASFAVVWLFLMVIQMARAPFCLYRDALEKGDALEERLAPRIELEFSHGGPFAYTDHVNFDGKELFRCYRFSAKNVGSLPLIGCKAQVASILEDGGRETVGIPFSLKRNLQNTVTFALQPGEKEFIDLIAVPLDPQPPRDGGKNRNSGRKLAEGI